MQSKVNKPTTKLFEGTLGNTSNFVVFGDGRTGIGSLDNNSMLTVNATNTLNAITV